VLGTSLELRVRADSERTARHAEAVVLAAVDRMETILSGWSGRSELARWLVTRDIDVPVSRELLDVLEASLAWRERTHGAFDPAAQADIERLRAGVGVGTPGEARRESQVPLWTIDHDAATARRRTTDPISLDAIAKGYVVARAAACAWAVEGAHDVLLNIGGDIQHFGARAVSVGVADPSAPYDNAPPIAVVQLRHAAVASSGGYRRGIVVDGRRRSHIVDPRTGRPAERIASASVIAPDCATADALSTAFSVMEPAESVALADALPGVGCLLVEADGAVTASAVWNACAVEPHCTNHSGD
jgi:FAD:protein FMN transferase